MSESTCSQLGITTRVTVPKSMDAVQGFEACCVHASPSSSYRMPGCSLENRLKGRCCDQSPCRSGTLNVEISGDGQKIIFSSDVNYEGTGYLTDSDLEIWVHHVVTSTTHRITHTRSRSSPVGRRLASPAWGLKNS